MKKNPCRYCVAAIEYKGRHNPSFTTECQTCKNWKEHKTYLDLKKKFTAGDPTTTWDELFKQTWVIWHGHTKHIETFRSMTVRTVEMFLEHGAFRKAVRKENGHG